MNRALFKELASDFTKSLFIVSLVLYLILALLELLQPGFVSFYFSSDIVLIPLVIFGAVQIIFFEE